MPLLGHDGHVAVIVVVFAEPIEFLRSPFIRPEDVHVYRELGIDIVKLADRSEPAEALARTARAYCEEKYEGNLFELIFRRGRKFRAGIAWSHPEARDLDVPIVIDNQALDRIGFIERSARTVPSNGSASPPAPDPISSISKNVGCAPVKQPLVSRA